MQNLILHILLFFQIIQKKSIIALRVHNHNISLELDLLRSFVHRQNLLRAAILLRLVDFPCHRGDKYPPRFGYGNIVRSIISSSGNLHGNLRSIGLNHETPGVCPVVLLIGRLFALRLVDNPGCAVRPEGKGEHIFYIQLPEPARFIRFPLLALRRQRHGGPAADIRGH